MNTEITGTSSEIVEQLTTITSGDHIMLIYPDMYSFKEIYSRYCKTALENNEIVLLLTYYETIDNVRQTLKEIGLDTEKYEKERALMIVQDITSTYFGSADDFIFFIKIFDKQQGKRGKNGISVFADMGVFFHHQQQNDKKNTVVEFERSLGSKFDIRLKRFCSYHKKDFDRFEESEKRELLEAHHLRINVLTC
jgi:MEDS: MEthanogen/methylotroph, DcmR Sensory domain